MGWFKKTFGFKSKEITRPLTQVYSGVYGGIYGMLADNSSYSGQEAKERYGVDPPPLPPEPYTSGSPYAPGAQGAWDENGFPIGPMPRGEFALDWQYEGNRRAEQRRQGLWGDAHGSMEQGQQALRQGTELFQSYRPGGSAALASGMFQSQANLHAQEANLYGTQAQTIEAPDLLMGWRDRAQQEAAAERKATERLNRTIGIAETAIGAVAAYGTGGASLGLVGSGLNKIANAAPAGGYDTAAVAGGVAPMGAQNAQGQTMMGPGWGNPNAGASGPGMVGGPNVAGGGVAPPGIAAPSGGGATQAGGGGDSGGGGGARKPAGAAGMAGPQGWPGGGAGGTAGGGAPGSQGGGVDMPGGSGMGAGGVVRAGQSGMSGDYPLEMFTQEETARNAMLSAPAVGPLVYQDWAEDEYRETSLGFFAVSARERLLRAMGDRGAPVGAGR